MKIKNIEIPDRIFGVESGLIMLFSPLVVLAVLIIISANLVIVPSIQNINQVNDSIKTINESKRLIVEKTDYLEKVDQNELKRNTDYISNALLPQKNAYLLVGIIRKIADNFNYQIDSFRIKPGELSKAIDNNKPVSSKIGVSPIPIELTLIGPTADYQSLIDGLEKTLPVLSLMTLEMKSSQTISKMDLTIQAYYLADNIKSDVGKLTLADLMLTSDESELVSTINKFTVVTNVGDIEKQLKENKDFVRYERVDPFSL